MWPSLVRSVLQLARTAWTLDNGVESQRKPVNPFENNNRICKLWMLFAYSRLTGKKRTSNTAKYLVIFTLETGNLTALLNIENMKLQNSPRNINKYSTKQTRRRGCCPLCVKG